MAKKTTNLTSAEKRKLDNQVNKINKRLIRMVKTGMFSSKAYNEITNQMVTLAGQLVQMKLHSMGYTQAPASGTGKLFKDPIKYETVYDPDGAPVRVPQLSRAAWVLEASQRALDDMEAVGTGLSERLAAEDFWRRTYSTEPTDSDIQKVLENDAAKSDLLSYVWDYLYGMKHIQEVQDFFSEVKDKTYEDKAEQDKYNDMAVALYSKYRSDVNEKEVRTRKLTPQQHAYVWGAVGKKGSNQKEDFGQAGRYLDSLMDHLKAGNDAKAFRAAANYLGVTKATRSYDSSNDLLVRYEAPDEEVEALIEWLKGDLK